MKFRNALMALTAMAAFAATTFTASAQQTMTLYQGAQVNGKLRQDINTGTAHVGDHFVMDVVAPYPSGDPRYNGAIITGTVASVTPAGQGVTPKIQLQFDTLRLSDGSVAELDASVSQQQQKQDSRNGGHVALSTIGGMIAGNIIGKTIFHTSGGGAVGAVGGFLTGYNKKSNFTLPAGSNLQITLNQNVTIRRQSPGGGYRY